MGKLKTLVWSGVDVAGESFHKINEFIRNELLPSSKNNHDKKNLRSKFWI